MRNEFSRSCGVSSVLTSAALRVQERISNRDIKLAFEVFHRELDELFHESEKLVRKERT